MITPIRSKSLTIIRRKTMGERLRNIHPGEILLEELLKPMEISQSRLPWETAFPDGSKRTW
jgi:hypothetical protein